MSTQLCFLLQTLFHFYLVACMHGQLNCTNILGLATSSACWELISCTLFLKCWPPDAIGQLIKANKRLFLFICSWQPPHNITIIRLIWLEVYLVSVPCKISVQFTALVYKSYHSYYPKLGRASLPIWAQIPPFPDLQIRLFHQILARNIQYFSKEPGILRDIFSDREQGKFTYFIAWKQVFLKTGLLHLLRKKALHNLAA